MKTNGFYDHSTVWGKLRIYFKRINWQWVLAGGIFCSLFALWVAAGGSTETNIQSNLLRQNSNLKSTGSVSVKSELVGGLFSDGVFTFQGSPGQSTIFHGFPADFDGTKVDHLILRKVYIDGKSLTDSLKPLKNLRSIDIETLGIVGGDIGTGLSKFARVYLPLLSDFKFNYLPHVNADVFKHPEILYKLLFCDTTPNQLWSFEKDVLNLGINITIVIDETILLDINRPLGILNINVHFCQQVLQNARGTYSKLILSWCPFTNGSSHVNPSIKYLNLNNALLPPQEFSKLLKSLKSLEEFHAFQPYLGNDDQAQNFYLIPEQPYFQIPIDLLDFSKNLKILSLSRLALVVNSPPHSNQNSNLESNIEDLSLEESNVTAAVLENFQTIFSRLTTVRLFNLKETSGIQEGTPARLLYEVIQTNAVKIVVTGYPRTSVKRNINSNYSLFIEEYLSSNYLGEKEDSFLILRGNAPDTNFDTNAAGNVSGNRGNNGTIVRSLTDLERNYKRFESMGFKDIDTFQDYLIYDSAFAQSGANFKVNFSYYFLIAFFVTATVALNASHASQSFTMVLY